MLHSKLRAMLNPIAKASWVDAEQSWAALLGSILFANLFGNTDFVSQTANPMLFCLQRKAWYI